MKKNNPTLTSAWKNLTSHFNKIKNIEISDDLKSNLEIDTQELTDKYIKKVDEMYSIKEKDILTL